MSLVAMVSGANVNFDRLRHISERAEVGEQREVILAVTIPEQRGSFRRFCSHARQALGQRIQLPLRRPEPRRTSTSA
jgi:threonine dehydratase